MDCQAFLRPCRLGIGPGPGPLQAQGQACKALVAPDAARASVPRISKGARSVVGEGHDKMRIVLPLKLSEAVATQHGTIR